MGITTSSEDKGVKTDGKGRYNKNKNTRFRQVFDLAHKVKQLDVYTSKYKKFDKEEDLLEWLLDVLEEKQAGFKIEDDDTRDAAWQQEA